MNASLLSAAEAIVIFIIAAGVSVATGGDYGTILAGTAVFMIFQDRRKGK